MKTMPNIEAIQEAVATHFGVDKATIIGRKRIPKHVESRHIAMFIARRTTTHTLSSIGQAFGNRDHGTVIHACQNVRNWMDAYPKVKNDVDSLIERVSI